jgi:hypothetical protein
MKTEKMSDLEIGIEAGIIIQRGIYPDAKSIEYDERQGCIWVEDSGFHSWPIIRINDPSQVFPIIVDNEISLIKLKNEWLACSEASFESICLSPDGSDNGVLAFNYNVEGFDVNPLRAAMIVFIKINQLSDIN